MKQINIIAVELNGSIPKKSIKDMVEVKVKYKTVLNFYSPKQS